LAAQLLDPRGHPTEALGLGFSQRDAQMSEPGIKTRFEESIQAHRPEDERRVECRHERERERKHEARKRQTPEQREHERIRKREARKRRTTQQTEKECARKREERRRQTHEQREREKERERGRCRRKVRPFMAIDGEGGGTDELKRQNYFLMMASEGTTEKGYILCSEGEHLFTIDCLEFLLSLLADYILVGYGIGYDVSQMLRGIKPPRLRQILYPPQGKNGPCYTYWGDYAIKYQQGQYFSVARIDRSGPKPAILKGSSRTIYETLGFFQCSFVKAIGDWNIGNDEGRALIAANKTRRDEFSQPTDEIIQYCGLECRYLAMLMTEFRDVCKAAGILPQKWSGAGWLAAALLQKHGVPKRPLTAREAAALIEREREQIQCQRNYVDLNAIRNSR
jgi:hypothetical protein